MDTPNFLPLRQQGCRVETQQWENVTVLQVCPEFGAGDWESYWNTDLDTDRSSVIASYDLDREFFRGQAMMAVYQHKSWWIRPAFPSALEEIPERTQLLLAGKDGCFTALLAVCGGVCRTDIGPDLHITVSANGCAGDEKSRVSLCIAQGTDPYACIHTMAATAAKLQGRSHILREHKQFPDMFRRLGWCTWDAFYHKVNQEDILKKLEEFRQKQVDISWMLIDDGWSDADYESRKLNSLGADAVKFPQGLAHTVETAKKEFGISQVGVWHAAMGYWTGMNPGSPIFEAWKERLIQRGEDYVLQPQEETVFAFYDAWHSLLASWGIDFIKVDGQGSASIYYKSLASYGDSSGGYLRALERSAKKHFHGNLINCMGMAAQNMWLREHSTLSRSSDDFVPQVPHGFREHALQNSFNSLLQGQFFWGDWDMFWSDHVENRQNSVLRAVSGGPVYVSDQLDKTDPTYILPLLGRDGEVNLCRDTGVPTLDCLLCDPLEKDGLFKIWNRYGGGFVTAAFHISSREQSCRDRLSTGDIPGLAGKRWLVYRYFGETAQVLSDSSPVELELEPNDAELLLLLPWQPEGQFIGNVEKYIGAYAVLSQESRDGCLRGCCLRGRIAFTVPGTVTRVLVNGAEAKINSRNGYCSVECPLEENQVAVYFA